MANTTHNGKDGGLLKGKRHYAKDGTPLGGIKAIVTDTGQQVELEGGEVIINREASKKHWKELSRINQSAGGGVPILPPDTVEADAEQYRKGGVVIDFNPNVLPQKWVYEYGKKIRDNYPKVWEQYANVFGNEAFDNLGGALKRGSWLDSEEWFYYKWKAFNPNHKGNSTLKGVLASLKWCTINSKGWGYMKAVINKEIKRLYPNSKIEKKKLGGNTEIITPDNEKFITPTFVSEKELPRIFAADAGVGEVNKVIQSVKLPFKVTEILGSGAYGTAFKTNRGTVLKVTSVTAEAFASYVISKSNFKSQAKVYNVFKITDGARNIFFIEKELVKVAKDFSEEEEFPLNNLFSEAFSTGSTRVGKKFTDKRIVELANDYYLEWIDEFKNDTGNTVFGTNGQGERALKELKAKKKYIVEHLYNLFIFFRDLEKESGTKEIDFNDIHDGNFGLSGNKFICFDCVSSGHKSFMLGGELAKGIKVENEHKDTLDKLYKHKITPTEAPKYIAKDHLKENKKYYTKLDEMESKFSRGSKVPENNVEVGDEATYLERGNTTPTRVVVLSQRIAPRGNKHASTVRNTKTGKSVEVYTDRLTKVGGSQQNPQGLAKFEQGEYVVLKQERDGYQDSKTGHWSTYKLYKISRKPLKDGNTGLWEYSMVDVKDEDSGIAYHEVPEASLVGAILYGNLPYRVGDELRGKDGVVYKVFDIKPETTYLNSKERDVETTKVLRNIAQGLWYVFSSSETSELSDAEKAMLYEIAESMSQDNFSEWTIKKGKKLGQVLQPVLDSLLAKGLVFNTYDDDSYDVDMYCVTCEGKKIAESLGWDSSGVEWYGSCEEEERKYSDGQYVLTTGAKDLLMVASHQVDKDGKIIYHCVFVEDLTRIYEGGIYEENLSDAVLESNLPFTIGDSIVDNYDNRIMLVSAIDFETNNDNEKLATTLEFQDEKTPLKNGSHKVINRNGQPKWVVSDVLRLLAKNLCHVVKKVKTDVSFGLKTPTGEQSKLTYLQQVLVRTDAFKQYFGDWEASAKGYMKDQVGGFAKHYNGVSKIVDLVTLEPRLMFHGTMAKEEFFVFEANRTDVARPYAYFSRNKEYAENFTRVSQRGGNKPFLYECFLKVLNPFMAIGTNYETIEEGWAYWLDKIALTITYDKYGEGYSAEQYEKTHKVVESQIGKYLKKVCGNEKLPFWRFMANDKKSEFKVFLMSHDYDGVEYGENAGKDYDINNPAHYTMATTLFDSDQIKLADGRNLDFNQANPDIRYEDGGNLEEEVSEIVPIEKTPTHENLTKKDQLGKTLFGDKYMERGGGVYATHEPKTLSDDRNYVEDLIAKMKD
jgi:hypothetical protein